MLDACFGLGGKASFVGFPTEDGSAGSCFRPTQTLGMSSTCRDKDAAWQFLRELLLPQYKDMDDLSKSSASDLMQGFPVNRSDYELIRKGAANGTLKRVLDRRIAIEGYPFISFHTATQEELARFEDLLNSTRSIALYDQAIYDIAYEVAGSYFAGDRTLDEAAQLIQNRVSLYLDEQM